MDEENGLNATDDALRLAADLQLDIEEIPSSREDGKVTKGDVRAFVLAKMAGEPEPEPTDFDPDKLPPLRQVVAGIRKKIARPRLKENGTEEIEYVLTFGSPDVQDGCERLYRRYGPKLVELMRPKVGGALTLAHVQEFEKKLRKTG